MSGREVRPQPGERYRHFKGNLYQVVGIARHSETGEELVIYQALYGDYGLYARPLAMFLSEVDREKYPEAEQKRRFEPVNCGSETEDVRTEDSGFSEEQQLILQLLDLRSAAERIELLQAKKEEVTEAVLDTMAAALDVQIAGDSTEEKFYDLLRCLEAAARFETSRMR